MTLAATMSDAERGVRRAARPGLGLMLDSVVLALFVGAAAALLMSGGLEALIGAAFGAAIGARRQGARAANATSGAFAGLFAGALFAGFFHGAAVSLIGAALG